MLDIYRRHSDSCPHREKGQGWTKCSCPIWCYGSLNGRPIRKAVKTRDWARAIRRIEKWETAPGKIAPATMLFEAATSYLADCGARKLAGSTIESYEKTIDHLKEYCGDIPLDHFDLAVLTKFRSSRQVAASTSGKELETLRAFCAFCLKRKWIAENYAKDIKPPKEDGPPTLPFERAEIDAILKACDLLEDNNPNTIARTRAMARARILVMLYAGLRISDTVKLRRKTVDLKTGQVLLRVQKTGRPLYIRLHPDAVDALRALPGGGEYFLWSGQSKLRTAVGNARKSIQRVLALAKVKGHPHRFRDTFSVELLKQGRDLRTVQLLLGHTSIKTTEKHYAPFVESFQRILDAATANLDFTGRKAPEKEKRLVQKPVQMPRRARNA